MILFLGGGKLHMISIYENTRDHKIDVKTYYCLIPQLPAGFPGFVQFLKQFYVACHGFLDIQRVSWIFIAWSMRDTRFDPRPMYEYHGLRCPCRCNIFWLTKLPAEYHETLNFGSPYSSILHSRGLPPL
jgi:hypothetical protein